MKKALPIFGAVTLLMLGVTMALAAGVLSLPTDPVFVAHGPWNAGTLGGTIDITLNHVPTGDFDVSDGHYAGWCIEDNFRDDFNGPVTLRDSTESDTLSWPPSYRAVPWDQVNYLLNHKNGTIQEVQAAMWLLTWGQSGTFPVTAAAQAMYDDAVANGTGFMPGPGQVVAVILEGDGLGPDGHQDTVIEVMVPQPEPAALGDRVWEDLDADGIQDAGEPGIPDVTVELYTCAGDPVASITTGADGLYLFDGLMPGNYYVMFYGPDGYIFSPPNQGADPALDSDADPTTGMTVCTTLESGETDLTWDAGLYMPMMGPGTGTPGYWTNHPEAWPKNADPITIGDVPYSKDVAIGLMKESVVGDKTFTIFPALVAAKLNVMIGNDDSCIAATITAADAWMGMHPVGSGVEASSDAWDEGELLYEMLDKYNNGELSCAPSRDSLE